MAKKGWKKNPQTGEWYDPEIVPACLDSETLEDAAELAPIPGFDDEPKTVDQAGEGSLTKIPAKSRKFAKGQ